MKKYALAVAAFLLVACGDTVENVNQTGADVVGSVADLPKCTDKNKGALALVEEDASVRVCANGEWVETKSGVDPDFSCKTEELKDGSGLKIICNGDSIGVVLNGNDGKAGKDGQSGTGCSITDRTDSTMTVVCGDSTIVMPMLPGTGNDTLELDSERVAVSLDSLAGYSQKGPFLKGSTVYLYELSDGRTLKQTNGNFTSIITRDDGRYKFTARDLASQYAMIVVEGYYRNEVTGKPSNASIRLRAITDMRKRSDANINLLTHLEFDRVYYLVTREHKTVKQAKKQAQNEIFKAFHIEIDENTDAEDLDVFGKTDADAALLAISVLLQGDGSETDLSVLLTEISDDLASDGKWDGPGSDSLKAKIADWAVMADGQGRLRDFRSNVKGWNLSKNEPPAFEKLVRNFVSIETKLGKCGDGIPVGTVKKIDDSRSQYYAKDYEDTERSKARFICADADSAWWRLATDIEKDTAGWGTGTNNNYTYEVRPGRINKNHYYYNEYMGETWREASVLEYDTYDYENNQPWEADEGDIRTGSVTDSVIYVYMDVDHQMTWRVADIIEAQLGGCVARRDSIGYARAICLEGGSVRNCGPSHIDLTETFISGHYVCKNIDEQDEFKWGWVLADDYESDTYGMECFEDGRLLDGKANASNKYVCDNGVFRMAMITEIENGLGCTSYNAMQIIKDKNGEFVRCDGFDWLYIDEVSDPKKTGFVRGDDGILYDVVYIAHTIWMPKNLDTLVEGGYCYEDSDSRCAIYGRLYTWDAAQKACPSGWKLPSESDWMALVEAAGGREVAGRHLKSLDLWHGVNNSTFCHAQGNCVEKMDTYGFSALPAGRKQYGRISKDLGEYAYFWSITENGSPFGVSLYYQENDVDFGYGSTSDAYSVRCVLDTL